MFINLKSSWVTPRLAGGRLAGMTTSVGAVSRELRSSRDTSGVEPELAAPEPGGAGPSGNGRILQVELKVTRQRKPSAKAAEIIAAAAAAAAAAPAAAAAAAAAGPAPAVVLAAAAHAGSEAAAPAASEEAGARIAAQQRKRSVPLAQELRQLHQQRQRAEKQGAQQQRAELWRAELLKPAPASVAGNARCVCVCGMGGALALCLPASAWRPP